MLTPPTKMSQILKFHKQLSPSFPAGSLCRSGQDSLHIIAQLHNLHAGGVCVLHASAISLTELDLVTFCHMQEYKLNGVVHVVSDLMKQRRSDWNELEVNVSVLGNGGG